MREAWRLDREARRIVRPYAAELWNRSRGQEAGHIVSD